MSSSGIVGALDIGGTHVTAGRVDVAARAVERRNRRALAGAASRAELLTAITRAAASIADLGSGRRGVAVPGPFEVGSLETVTVAEHLDDAALFGAARYVAAGAG